MLALTLLSVCMIQDFRISPGFRITPSSPKAEANPLYGYADGCDRARETSRTMITWIGLFPENRPGYVNATPDKGMAAPNWWPKKGVVISLWIGPHHYGVPVPLDAPSDLTVSVIRRTINSIRESANTTP